MVRIINIRVRRGDMKRSIENFGSGRFLVRVGGKTNEEINKEVVEMLSRYLGHPMNRIELIGGSEAEDKVFQLV
ncbi:MAG TPA: hypothetical protein P5277_00835 [Candidatus Paceibacterota bacterium]|nr:hypothetical protein [Candidatus Paceibacterota bacterium]